MFNRRSEKTMTAQDFERERTQERERHIDALKQEEDRHDDGLEANNAEGRMKTDVAENGRPRTSIVDFGLPKKTKTLLAYERAQEDRNHARAKRQEEQRHRDAMASIDKREQRALGDTRLPDYRPDHPAYSPYVPEGEGTPRQSVAEGNASLAASESLLPESPPRLPPLETPGSILEEWTELEESGRLRNGKNWRKASEENKK